jgi:hypothetical protein
VHPYYNQIDPQLNFEKIRVINLSYSQTKPLAFINIYSYLFYKPFLNHGKYNIKSLWEQNKKELNELVQ